MLNFITGFIVCAVIFILILLVEIRFARKESSISDKFVKLVDKFVPKEKGVIIKPLVGFNKAYHDKVINSPVDVKLDDVLNDD